jgi:predicted O-methyltransferase YrrM
MVSPLMCESDKLFWHGFVDFYEEHLRGRQINSIAEFGVLNGNSIRWLMDRFPTAKLCGIDWVDENDSWPKSDRVSYFKVNQDSPEQVAEFFRGRTFDMIIEDGSHIPRHQATCLIQGLDHLNAGGVYILEDIHTSMPDHPYYKKHASRYLGRLNQVGTALSTLLAIQHLKRIGADCDAATSQKIAKHSYFSKEDVSKMFDRIKEVRLYRRSHLPDKCYNCGSADFDYTAMVCSCGVDIFKGSDSMSFFLEAI